MPLLEVDDLTVSLSTARGPAEAVRGVSFALDRGETLGLVGESGSGKSMTALAILGLLPEGARTEGRVRFDGLDLLTLAEAGLCRVRGDRIGVVFQEPMTALNPLHSIGRQVAETLMLHRGMSARARATGGDSPPRPRRHSRCGAPRRCLSASVLRRTATARHHRHRARLRAGPPHRRRADHRARRHHSAPDPRSHRRPRRGGWNGAPDDLA